MATACLSPSHASQIPSAIPNRVVVKKAYDATLLKRHEGTAREEGKEPGCPFEGKARS